MKRNKASEVSSCPQQALDSTHPVTSLTCSHIHVSKQLLLSRLHMKIPNPRSFRRKPKPGISNCVLSEAFTNSAFCWTSMTPETAFPFQPTFKKAACLPSSSLCMALQAQASLPGAHWYFLKENRAPRLRAAQPDTL